MIDKVFENELEYHYTFLCYDNENKNENFVLSKLIELENEKIVMITLLNSFFDNDGPG